MRVGFNPSSGELEYALLMLTHKQLETPEFVLNTVATDALVQIHSAD